MDSFLKGTGFNLQHRQEIQQFMQRISKVERDHHEAVVKLTVLLSVSFHKRCLLTVLVFFPNNGCFLSEFLEDSRDYNYIFFATLNFGIT